MRGPQINVPEMIKVKSNIQSTPNTDFTCMGEKAKSWLLNSVASVKLTIFLMSLMATMVLLGAWCPQITQAGQNKVFEQFGEQKGQLLIDIGIADIFHSAAFLLLIAALTVNIIFGSFRHVFPKLKLLKLPMPWLTANQIAKLPIQNKIVSHIPLSELRDIVVNYLKSKGYKVKLEKNQLTAESGKFGRLAPSVTHIGLLTLLAGVIWTSWTGFSGFKAVVPGEQFTLSDAEHSKFWFGKFPEWSACVNETHREDYPSGEPKQWYSNVSVKDKNGKLLKQQTISVNEPLSYDGVDMYQSSWSLKDLKLRFNNQPKLLQLQPMGKLFAAFLPLPQKAVMIFSVRDAQAPLRIFAKREDWRAPKLLSQIALNQKSHLGSVSITYDGTIPQTGLQYKCDPGLPVVFLSFIFLIGGISLAAVPHRQIWATFDNVSPNSRDNSITVATNSTIVTIGGTTKKGKMSLGRQISTLIDKVQKANVI